MIKKRYSISMTVIFFAIFFAPAFKPELMDLIWEHRFYGNIFWGSLFLIFPIVAGCFFSSILGSLEKDFKGKDLQTMYEFLYGYRIFLWPETAEKIRNILKR